MDGGRFDQFTKLIGASPSRRRVLKALVGGAVTSIAASIGLRETSAAVRKRGMGVVCSKNADCTSGACRRIAPAAGIAAAARRASAPPRLIPVSWRSAPRASAAPA